MDTIHPHIKTYGRIRGRLTSDWPFNLNSPPPWFITTAQNTAITLPQNKEIILEVGCGMGDSLFEMCQAYPDFYFIGVEIYEPGLVKLARRMFKQPLNNLLIIQGDIIDRLNLIPSKALSRIHVFFPDPWPKIRHYKRRLHRGNFFQKCELVLKTGGRMHLATDVPEYAHDWIKHAPMTWIKCEDDVWIMNRKHTKYEARGENLGHDICDIVYIV